MQLDKIPGLRTYHIPDVVCNREKEGHSIERCAQNTVEREKWCQCYSEEVEPYDPSHPGRVRK